MRSIINLLINPIVYGLAWVVLLVLAHYTYPQYTSFIIIALIVWGLGLGLAYAFAGDGDKNGPTDSALS